MDEVVNHAYAKHGQFRGLARVALKDLQYDANHAFFPQNVLRLSRIFQLEGCQRLDERNFIDVLATDSQLDGLSPECLHDTPQQTWEIRPILGVGSLKCLTGQHRIRAAQKFLDSNDQWWIARVYSDHLSSSPRLRLREEYTNEKAPCDGEIFYKIRQYSLANDEANELKWWARLTETKRKDLRQLLKDVRYAKAFDGMLSWPGLWAPVKLGSLHRLLCLKCDEELLAYLGYISATWTSITANIDVRNVVDASSVEQLQSLAPHHSSADAETIDDMIKTNKIFTTLTGESDRSVVLANLHSIQSMIPSLFTFFEDLKYLEPCAKVLKALLPPRGKKSIFRGLMGSYFPQDQIYVEHASNDMRIHTGSGSEIVRSFAYQQLWLFALRNFPLMTNFTTRKVLDKDKPAAVEPSPHVWREFGELASLLGFKTSAIDELCSRDSTKLVVAQLFDRFSEPGLMNDSRAADEIAAILKALNRRREPVGEPCFTGGDQISLAERCGRPFEDDHRIDRPYLYLPHIHRTPATGTTITTFYRKWCMFRIFLGIRDVPPKSFDHDVTTEIEDNEVDGQTAASDAPDNQDNMIEDLKRRFEQQAQKTREAQSEHECSIRSLGDNLRAEVRTNEGLRKSLQEMHARVDEYKVEKHELHKEVQKMEGKATQAGLVAGDLRLQLDQSFTKQEELGQQVAMLRASLNELGKSKEDDVARVQASEAQVRQQLQSQRSTEILALKEKIRNVEDERDSASAKYWSAVKNLEGVLREKGEQIQSLQRELSEFQEATARDRQKSAEEAQMSAEQAQKDTEIISILNIHLAEARGQVEKLTTETGAAHEKIAQLEKDLREARESVATQAEAIESEQYDRYNAEVAVKNSKVEHAMAVEASKKIHEELIRAKDRGREVEGKMKTLEGELHSHKSGSSRLTLVTWERVGDTCFTKLFLTVYKEEALLCVRSLELCSQENCDKWDYVGFDRRRIPLSMKRDEKTLVDVWIQGGIMGRWLVADRAFFEVQAAHQVDMPTWGSRPRLPLKRKPPLALTEGTESRAAKRGQFTTGRIEEI